MPLCTKVKIEVPFFIFIFALIFADSINTNWIMFKTCYVTLGYNKSECALLGTKHPDNSTARLEQLVEPHATVIIMAKQLVAALGTPFICFFLGPWSDRYGRKPVFLLTIGGVVLEYLILATICEIPNISPWFMLLSIIPKCLSGGFLALLAAILCYINDITSFANRGMRIAIFYAVITLGFLLASMASSYALRAMGYFMMYLTAASIAFLAWLIIFLFLEESVQNPETESKYRNLFQFSLLQETVRTTFKRRDNYNRSMLLLTLLSLVIFLIADNTSSIMFLYVREKFHWSLEAFTMFNSINIVVGTLGSVAGIYILHKLLYLNESTVIIIGFISVISSSILFGLASKRWQIYAAAGISCLYGTVSPMSRSLISKLVEADEYGKVFAFLAVCESFISPLGSPLFTYLYNNTLSTFPGIFLLVAAGISTLGMIVFMAVAIIHRNVGAVSRYEMLNPQHVTS